jgi:hypothetical protein
VEKGKILLEPASDVGFATRRQPAKAETEFVGLNRENAEGDAIFEMMAGRRRRSCSNIK